jgi:glycosyltransferase involved in cell wall biosynthesis
LRILQLCKKFPYPLKDGESIAVTYLAKALNDIGCKVTLLAMNTTKHPVAVSKLVPEIHHYQHMHYINVDNEVKPLLAFLDLFSNDLYNISRFESPAFASKLRQLLNRNEYDLIQLESLYLTPYIPLIRKHSGASVVLRAHNVEHEIWERMSMNADMTIRRWYFEYIARKLKKYELEQLKSIDYLLPISSRDFELFNSLGYRGPGHAVPIGLDLQDFSFQKISTKEPLAVSYIGSLDWMPNVEGLNWFLDRIWPHLSLIFPGLTLHIAGRNCPDWILNLAIKNIVVHGEVEDSRSFLLKYPVSVVPLLSGSGMRVKILEAMALGRVVVSTNIGLEGLPVHDKREILIADDEEEFIRKFRFIYHHRRHLTELSVRARKLVEREFDYLTIAKDLMHVYQILQPNTQS